MTIIRKQGFDFGFDPVACDECPSYCCCGESGYVWVSQQEFSQICEFLHINPVDCLDRYFQRVGNALSLKERVVEGRFECVFIEGAEKRCSVYEVRPVQCREFPFWNYFKKHKDEVVRECPGIRQ